MLLLQSQDSFCCSCFPPTQECLGVTVNAQLPRMLDQSQASKPLAPGPSKICILISFSQSLCSPPLMVVSRVGKMTSGQCLCPKILYFPYVLCFFKGFVYTRIHSHSQGFRLLKTKTRRRLSQTSTFVFSLPSLTVAMSTKAPS